ncbi:hypothetical protein PGH47_00870 [Streptomyces sp. HUAS 31]|uniref:hypothetical protein n=1 Tax=Streptomyces sp. HUAS 31 TaxID=3020055 RepID=UPI00230568FC|nr:hypothetical protein [Streptomyces sp. HUAS 31]WCD94275.1 hypothetical protein PGH47_00870 [Streptomyces sp. HUAS 31]
MPGIVGPPCRRRRPLLVLAFGGRAAQHLFEQRGHRQARALRRRHHGTADRRTHTDAHHHQGSIRHSDAGTRNARESARLPQSGGER